MIAIICQPNIQPVLPIFSHTGGTCEPNDRTLPGDLLPLDEGVNDLADRGD